jgi:hypothetical protein
LETTFRGLLNLDNLDKEAAENFDLTTSSSVNYQQPTANCQEESRQRWFHDNITLRYQSTSLTTICLSTSTQLNPEKYIVAWIAPLEIEALAALKMLDNRHRGRFPVRRGDEYIFHAGDMYGHNIIIATLPASQEYGTGSAASLAGQLKKTFPNLWFGLLVGVAAGLPDLSRTPARDIRLGDVLVGLPEGESAGLIAYDLGKETNYRFEPLRFGQVLSPTEEIVRSAIGAIKVDWPNEAQIFRPYYETI